MGLPGDLYTLANPAPEAYHLPEAWVLWWISAAALLRYRVWERVRRIVQGLRAGWAAPRVNPPTKSPDGLVGLI